MEGCTSNNTPRHVRLIDLVFGGVCAANWDLAAGGDYRHISHLGEEIDGEWEIGLGFLWCSGKSHRQEGKHRGKVFHFAYVWWN